MGHFTPFTGDTTWHPMIYSGGVMTTLAAWVLVTTVGKCINTNGESSGSLILAPVIILHLSGGVMSD